MPARRHKTGRAHYSPRSRQTTLRLHLLGKPEIRDLGSAIAIEQDVGGL